MPPRTPAELRSYIKACWVLAVCAALGIGYAGYSYWRQQDFVTHATHIQGKIVGNVHIVGRNSDHFTAIFTFTDAAGKPWKVRDRGSHYRMERAVIGEPCAVLYDPANPAEAQLETEKNWFDTLGIAFVPGVTGIVLGAVAAYALRQHYATLRKLRVAGGDGTVPRDPAILEGP